jgi:GNAT superfamily N-acetyltransferase
VSEAAIRRAVPADALAAATVYVGAAGHAERGFLPDAVIDAMTPEAYRESWDRRLGSPEPHATWIAEHRGVAVGICYVMPSHGDDAKPTTGHVDMLFVLPEHAGQGIGARLLAIGIDHLRSSGFTEATLWALARNERTKRFYRREGWTEADETMQVEDDGFTVELVRFSRSLTDCPSLTPD